MQNHLYVIQVDTIHNNVRKLPDNLLAVMGYVTGTPDIQWTNDDWNYFYGASKVKVDQSPTLSKFAAGEAHVADIERGAATIQEFISAAQERLSRGLDSTLYISYDSLIDAQMRIDAARLRHVRYFVADYGWSAVQAARLIQQNPEWVGAQFANVKENPRTTIPGTNLTLSDVNCDLSVKIADWFPAPSFAGTAWVEGR